MSELAFVRDHLHESIAPSEVSSHIGERIRAAALMLRWKPSRTKDIWYGDERVSIKPRELRKIEEITGVRYGHAELTETDRLIARADAILANRRPGNGGQVLAALRALVGASDRPGTGP